MADATIKKIKIDPMTLGLDDNIIVEDFNLGTSEVWITDGSVHDSIQRKEQRALEERLNYTLENGVVWSRTATSYVSPFTFSYSGTIINILTPGKVVINGRIVEVSPGQINIGSLTSGNYYLLVTLTTGSTTGDIFNFGTIKQTEFSEINPSHRNNRVRIATFIVSDGNITGIAPFNDELTCLVMNNSITTVKIRDLAVTETKLANSAVTTIKLADSAVTTTKLDNLAVTNAKLAGSITHDKISTVPNHTHEGVLGDGGNIGFQNIHFETNPTTNDYGGGAGVAYNIFSKSFSLKDSSNKILILLQVSVTNRGYAYSEVKLKIKVNETFPAEAIAVIVSGYSSSMSCFAVVSGVGSPINVVAVVESTQPFRIWSRRAQLSVVEFGSKA